MSIPPGCAPFDADLSALLDGELGAARAAEVRRHADACGRCAKRLEALSEVDAALRGLSVPDVSPDASARLRRRIAEPMQAPPRPSGRPAPPRPRRSWLGIGIGASLAAGLLAALLVPRLVEEDRAARPPSDLAEVSDEEIELALTLDVADGASAEALASTLADWELIEQLHVIERLDSLEREHG